MNSKPSMAERIQGAGGFVSPVEIRKLTREQLIASVGNALTVAPTDTRGTLAREIRKYASGVLT
uniref:Uncharacterized protein n=1 Tax=viral metagenome TaxID=1070528 RepID=A0A6M3KW67_9ZZZZ